MIRKLGWTMIGAVLIIAGITVAWTQTQQWHADHRPTWFHHGPMSYMAHELNLSDTQKSQIKAIWESERPNISELVHQFASEQKEIDALTFQGLHDEERIQDIGARQGVTLEKLIIEREELTRKIYTQVLNPAQRTKADEIRRRWNSRLDAVANRIGNTSGAE